MKTAEGGKMAAARVVGLVGSFVSASAFAFVFAVATGRSGSRKRCDGG